jgi:hypothetical protein
VIRSDPLFIKAKDCIDQSEMSSDYFHNYPRKFRGAYYPVTLKFIASLMVNSLVRKNQFPLFIIASHPLTTHKSNRSTADALSSFSSFWGS